MNTGVNGIRWLKIPTRDTEKVEPGNRPGGPPEPHPFRREWVGVSHKKIGVNCIVNNHISIYLHACFLVDIHHSYTYRVTHISVENLDN